MAKITLKGREIPLLFTTWEMKQVGEEIAPFSKAIDLVTGRDPEGNKSDRELYGSAEHLDAVAKMIRIMGNAGLEEAGEAPDLTDKFILRAVKPKDLAMLVNECMNALNDGMASEIPAKEENGPVDVTLEEMNKKKEAES